MKFADRPTNHWWWWWWSAGQSIHAEPGHAHGPDLSVTTSINQYSGTTRCLSRTFTNFTGERVIKERRGGHDVRFEISDEVDSPLSGALCLGTPHGWRWSIGNAATCATAVRPDVVHVVHAVELRYGAVVSCRLDTRASSFVTRVIPCSISLIRRVLARIRGGGCWTDSLGSTS